MKNTVFNVALLLFLAGAAGSQNAVLSPPPDKDPSVGVWMKNKDKSPPITVGVYVLLETDHSQTVAREGDDIVVTEEVGPTRWRGANAISKRTKTTSKFRCDGNLYRVPGGSVSCNYVAANVIEGKQTYERNDVMFHRHTTYFWRTEISADGKEMTDSCYKDAAMTKPVFVTVFDRAK